MLYLSFLLISFAVLHGIDAFSLPPTNGPFDYQLGGAYPPPAGVKTLVRDKDDPSGPVAGLYNICYLNGFQTQPGNATWWRQNHDSVLLRNKRGEYFKDPDWPDEFLLDTSSAAKREEIAAVVGGWIDECKAKGYQAVEFDNLDTFTRVGGLLSKANNVALATLYVTKVHGVDLAAAQKNTADLGSAGRDTVKFDFAIVEECAHWNECDVFTDVYGNNVLEIEYTDDDEGQYAAQCKEDGVSRPIILRDRELAPAGEDGYHYEACSASRTFLGFGPWVRRLR